MGWLYSLGWKTKADILAHLTRPSRFSDGYELVKSTTRGKAHYYLLRDKANGNHIIGVDLMAFDKEGWGYKDLDESCGPNEIDCPISWLSLPHGDYGEYSRNWRAACTRRAMAKRSVPKREAGQLVRYGKHVYRLVSPAGPRRGWMVEHAGIEYRMTARQVARAELLLPSATMESRA